jgi:hypothetical protein
VDASHEQNPLDRLHAASGEDAAIAATVQVHLTALTAALTRLEALSDYDSAKINTELTQIVYHGTLVGMPTHIDPKVVRPVVAQLATQAERFRDQSQAASIILSVIESIGNYDAINALATLMDKPKFEEKPPFEKLVLALMARHANRHAGNSELLKPTARVLATLFAEMDVLAKEHDPNPDKEAIVLLDLGARSLRNPESSTPLVNLCQSGALTTALETRPALARTIFERWIVAPNDDNTLLTQTERLTLLYALAMVRNPQAAATADRAIDAYVKLSPVGGEAAAEFMIRGSCMRALFYCGAPETLVKAVERWDSSTVVTVVNEISHYMQESTPAFDWERTSPELRTALVEKLGALTTDGGGRALLDIMRGELYRIGSRGKSLVFYNQCHARLILTLSMLPSLEPADSKDYTWTRDFDTLNYLNDVILEPGRRPVLIAASEMVNRCSQKSPPPVRSMIDGLDLIYGILRNDNARFSESAASLSAAIKQSEKILRSLDSADAMRRPLESALLNFRAFVEHIQILDQDRRKPREQVLAPYSPLQLFKDWLRSLPVVKRFFR